MPSSGTKFIKQLWFSLPVYRRTSRCCTLTPTPMDQDHWPRVDELYHSAMERAPETRDAFLEEACSNADLRREVKTLLAQSRDGVRKRIVHRDLKPANILVTKSGVKVRTAPGESFQALSPAPATLRGYAEKMAAWFGRDPCLCSLPWEEWRVDVSQNCALRLETIRALAAGQHREGWQRAGLRAALWPARSGPSRGWEGREISCSRRFRSGGEERTGL